MAIFTVHVPREAADPVARAERTMFVRDGFSVAAFLFGPLYLLRHRAYLAALAWVVLVALGAWACHVLHLPGGVGLVLLLLAMVFTGLEASSIRRFALYRRGLDVAAVVGGRRLEDGERAYFRDAGVRSAPPAAPVPSRSMRMPATGVIGLFPDDGASA